MSASNIALLAPNLDKHLLLPILTFLNGNGLDTTAAKKKLIQTTCLFDNSIELHAGDEEAIKSLEAARQSFVAKIKKLRKAAEPLINLYFTTEEDRLKLKLSQKELAEEQSNGRLVISALRDQQVTQASVDALYDLAFAYCDAGLYDEASDLLTIFSLLEGKKPSPKDASALWGKLVCDTQMGFWDQTQNDIQNLRDQLDQSGTSVARATLLHYSLFTYFKRVGAAQLFLEHVIDFSTYVYANTVQIVCPYLLRYLAAAAILMRKKRSVLKKVAKMAEQEAHAYSDSFTQFLVSVTELDFPTANECLKKLAVEAETDFFLKEHKEDLIKAARMMVYEDYLRVHRTVSIPAVAAQLGMDVDKAEIWLVTLIQEAKIDAEVDSVSRKILVTPAARTIHRDVISRLETIARPVN